jgi:TPR repeat protein
LYEEAAGRNDTEGLMALGWMHEHGKGVETGIANTTHALELYWRAVDGAPGAHYAAAPLLLYLWLRLRLLAGWVTLKQGSLRTAVLSVLTLLLSLTFVLWLRRSRVRTGLRQDI